MTVADFKRQIGEVSKDLNSRGVKEFYLIFSDGDFQPNKFTIPEKYRGEFEPFYTGGDHGVWINNTGEYIYQFAEDMDALLIIFDDEVDSLIEKLKMLRS